MPVSHVPSAARTLRVLRFLAARPGPVSLECIARSCDLPRSAAYHLLNTMVDEGFVVHLVDEHRFRLGRGAHEAGLGHARRDALISVARGPLVSLVDHLGISAYLVLGEGRDIVAVHEERGHQMPPLLTGPARQPARASASGHVLLAEMPIEQVRVLYAAPSAFGDGQDRGPRDLAALEVAVAQARRSGYAVSDLALPRMSAVAAPVRGAHDSPVAVVLVHRRDTAAAAGVDRLGQEARRLAWTLGALLTDRTSAPSNARRTARAGRAAMPSSRAR